MLMITNTENILGLTVGPTVVRPNEYDCRRSEKTHFNGFSVIAFLNVINLVMIMCDGI